MSRPCSAARFLLVLGVLALVLSWVSLRALSSAWQRNSGMLRMLEKPALAVSQTTRDRFRVAVQNGDRRARFWIGYLYAYEGRATEAQQIYSDSMDLAYWLVLHGRNLYDANPQLSIKMYERAISIAPKYSPAFFFMGQAYQRLRQYKQAIEWYTRALEAENFDPRLASEYPYSGEGYHKAGYANVERVYQHLAECYIALRDWGSAVQAAEHLLRRKPDQADGYFLMGQIDYFRAVYQIEDARNTLNRAEDALRSAVRLNPNHFWAYVFLGRVYMQMNRLDDALREFELAVSINPDDPSGREELGRTLLAIGRVDEAVHHLEVAQTLYPSKSSGWVLLGDAYTAQGRMDLARRAYEQALRLDPEYEPAKQRLLTIPDR